MTANDVPLVFHVRLQVKPERVQDWLDAVHALIDRMAEDGAITQAKVSPIN